MLKAINPQGAPAPSFYSQGMEATAASRTLYVSGQVGVEADGSVSPEIGQQARAAIGNLNGVLAAAGMDGRNLAKLTIYLTDEADMQGFMEAAAGSLPTPPPATTLLFVKGLASPAFRVEIEAIAVG